jgi:hypothetical protein
MEPETFPQQFSNPEGDPMRVRLAIVVLTVIAAVSSTTAAAQQGQKADKPQQEKRNTLFTSLIEASAQMSRVLARSFWSWMPYPAIRISFG